MGLAFALGAAAASGACGWPAGATIDALSRRLAGAADSADATSQHDTGARTSVNAAELAHASSQHHAGAHTTVGSWLLPLLLAATAFGVAVRLQPALVAAAGCWLVVCGVPLAIIDIRVRRLPDVLTGACLAGTAALLTAAAASTADWDDLARAAGGSLAIGMFFGVLALARPGSAGLGDAKLGLSTGAVAGWLGWGPLLASIFVAFVLAAAAGLWLIGTRRATIRGTSLPFGPFLLAGCLVVVLLSGVGHGDHVAALL